MPLAVIAATPLTNSVSPTHSQRLRSVGAVHRAAFHVDRAADVVAALQVRQQLVEQIARRVADDVHEAVIGRRQVAQDRRRPVPQMMMRIDDRQVGFEDVLRGIFGCPRPQSARHASG